MNEEPKIWYSSHGNPCRWSEIRELEVVERGNYTDEDFNKWEKKYGIVQNDMAIWVTPDRRIALTYADIAANYDKILNLPEEALDSYEDEMGGLERFYPTDGFIVSESDDGDKGYIMVIRNEETLCRERVL